MATMRRPLRSKRARISPVRLRANASGLTRMRVRSTYWSSVVSCFALPSPQAATLQPGDVTSRRRHLSLGRLRPAPAARPRGGRRHRLGLAERAQLPRRVDRLGARVAALLEAPHAARAAQEVRADRVIAVRAEREVELAQARLGRLQLELAQAHVVQILRR